MNIVDVLTYLYENRTPKLVEIVSWRVEWMEE